MSLSIVIMAAGKGTRMKSARPKVLHKLAGRPMLSHVIGTTATLQAAQQIVITGHGAELVEPAMSATFPQAPLSFVRDASGQQVLAIVEHKDASAEQRAIREVYTGMMAAPTAHLKRWLGRLTNNNAQGEYYLTDVVAMAQAEGVPVVAAQPQDEGEGLGGKRPAQPAGPERRHQRAPAERLMEQGVRLAD